MGKSNNVGSSFQWFIYSGVFHERELDYVHLNRKVATHLSNEELINVSRKVTKLGHLISATIVN